MAKRNADPVPDPNRPDLALSTILSLLAVTGLVAGGVLLWPGAPAPGSPAGQTCAALGALLLLAPFAFSIMKRSGASANPPAWFVAHVLAAMLGSVLIFVHVAAGNWLTPPGIVLLLLVFLVVQGSLVRAFLTRGFALLFARPGAAHGFAAPAGLDTAALAAIIDAKVALLARLDPNADEGQFSPTLGHWLRRPLLSLRYQWLAESEARQVGARAAAGVALGWSRRLHLLAAWLFYLGLAAHVVVVLLFAGYAAGDGPIDWWHIADWGR